MRDLLGHLTGLATAFRDAARKDLGASTAVSPDATLPVLDDDWCEVLPRRLEEVAAAWRSPDAWTGLTRAGGVELPGEVAGAVALNELVVHGWDLARSTGQPYAAGEAELRSCEALLAPAEDGPNGSPEDGSDGSPDDGSDDDSLFGPPVPVPGDAPLLDRVIALLTAARTGSRAAEREGSRHVTGPERTARFPSGSSLTEKCLLPVRHRARLRFSGDRTRRLGVPS